MIVRELARRLSAVFSWIVVFAVSVTFAAEIPGIRVVSGPTFDDGLPVSSVRPDLAVTDVGDDAVLTVIEDTLSISENNGRLSIVGEVRNDGEYAAGRLELGLAGLDAEGELVDVASSWNGILGDSYLSVYGIVDDVIVPGKSGIFSTSLFPQGAQVETVLISVSGREVDFEPSAFPLEMTGDWEIEEWSPGLTKFTSVVRNVGSTDIISLSVTVGARDQTGNMLIAHRVYPRGDRIGGYLGGIRAGGEIEVEFVQSVDIDEISAVSVETRLAGRPYEGGIFAYGVAGVAHAPGAYGSVWRSSLGLTNRSGAAGGVSLGYHHSGGRADAELVLADGEAANFDDVVQSLFGVGGASTGYIQIRSSVPLTVGGRTVNETPGGGFGQALPVFTSRMTWDLSHGQPGVLSTLRGGPPFRTNIGLVNMADQDCTVRVRIFEPSGIVVSDPGLVEMGPTEWRQLNNAVRTGVDAAYATIEPLMGCPIWAYASVIENTTGDPTTVVVEPGIEINLAPSRSGGISFGPPWADLGGPPTP